MFTTRKLPVPKTPQVTQSVSPSVLVEQLDNRWAALDSFYATVEIQASTLKKKDGVEKDYTTFPGIIMMRKPESLRVYGRVPVIGSRMFDMVSDGTNFTLYIPSKSLVYKGANALHKHSANTIENMRPGFFFDAMVVRGLEPGESVLVRDGARGFYIATVRDISFDLTETHYRLELGAPMDAAEVLGARRDALVSDARDAHSRVDIPELLALLRAARPLAPEPRPALPDIARRTGR